MDQRECDVGGRGAIQAKRRLMRSTTMEKSVASSRLESAAQLVTIPPVRYYVDDELQDDQVNHCARSGRQEGSLFALNLHRWKASPDTIRPRVPIRPQRSFHSFRSVRSCSSSISAPSDLCHASFQILTTPIYAFHLPSFSTRPLYLTRTVALFSSASSPLPSRLVLPLPPL